MKEVCSICLILTLHLHSGLKHDEPPPPQPRLSLLKAFSGVGLRAAECPHRASRSAKPFRASAGFCQTNPSPTELTPPLTGCLPRQGKAGDINQLPSSSGSTDPAIRSRYQPCFQLPDSTQSLLICRASQPGFFWRGGVHSSTCEPLNLHSEEFLGGGKTNGLPPGAGFLLRATKWDCLHCTHTNWAHGTF